MAAIAGIDTVGKNPVATMEVNMVGTYHLLEALRELKLLERIEPSKINSSHGTGEFKPEDFRRLGKGVVFEKGVLVFHPENIEIGDNVYIGIGPKVIILTSQHEASALDLPVYFTPLKFAEVVLEDGCDIGEGAIVGAGPVVTHNIPSYEVWAGVPARRIRGG